MPGSASAAIRTVTGKGDGGRPLALPRRVTWLCYAVVVPWALFTAVIYVIILAQGSFAPWGATYALTLAHYVTAFPH